MFSKEANEDKQFMVLLVFASNDAQCVLLRRASEQQGNATHLAHSLQEMATSFERHRHDVIVVDVRFPAKLDPLSCAKYVKSSQSGDENILVALRSQKSIEETSIEMSNLINIGFDRQLIESLSKELYMSELICLRHERKKQQTRLHSLNLYKSVADNCNDAVQITDASHQIQYVNKSFENFSGYSSSDIVGRTVCDLFNMNVDVISNQLMNGKPWSGVCHLKRKNGEKLPQNCQMLPVFDTNKKIVNYISIRNPLEEKDKFVRQSTIPSYQELPVESVRRTRSRKESVARMTSMTIEAPITKVIAQIMRLHEATSGSVSLALDAILDSLRSSELYAPFLTPKVREDKFTSDFVGGLITMDEDIWNHRRVSVIKRSLYTPDHTTPKSFATLANILLESSPEINELLETESSWEFDIFKLERLTQNRPLSHLAARTFQRFEVCEFLNVNSDVMLTWLMMIESSYHETNAYHNSTHAADVMHATAYFLSSTQIKELFDHVDEVASLIAAVIHDLDHPGKTNSFLVNSNAELALLYNDLAVLESHHVSRAFQLTLKNPNCNIFKNLSRDNFKMLRQQIVDMVLATEMTKHFEHLNKFVSVVNQVDLQDSSDLEGSTEGLSKLSTIENLTLVKRMLIKCADISNPARPLPLCKEWAIRIAKEYCKQTDAEKAQGLPVVMPIFNSSACNLPKTQISFIDLFINDMFDAWIVFCNLNEMLTTIKENYSYWKQLESQNELILIF